MSLHLKSTFPGERTRLVQLGSGVYPGPVTRTGVGRLRAEAHRSSNLNGAASPVNGGSRNTLLREGSLWAEQILQRVGFCG